MIRKRCSYIAQIVEHPEDSILKVWFVNFNLAPLTQNTCVKPIYSASFRSSTKEAVISCLSLSNVYVAFAKHKLS